MKSHAPQPDPRKSHHTGWTLIEALAVLALAAALLALTLPVLSHQRGDALLAKCAEQQKRLVAAAHNYATDFKGRFFYTWWSGMSPTGSTEAEDVETALGYWFDQQRVGRYLNDLHPVGRLMHEPGGFKPQSDGGMGGGSLLCPADLVSSARSYGMNFFGYGVGQGKGVDRLKKSFPLGEFFDAESSDLDKLLLFSEAFQPLLAEAGWVTNERFGEIYLPGERFGGSRDRSVYLAVPQTPFYASRYEVKGFPTAFDYARHAPWADRRLPEGLINIGFADGHVTAESAESLYDARTLDSTYRVLWSPGDRRIELDHRDSRRERDE